MISDYSSMKQPTKHLKKQKRLQNLSLRWQNNLVLNSMQALCCKPKKIHKKTTIPLATLDTGLSLEYLIALLLLK